MYTCKNCGNTMETAKKFCPKCGSQCTPDAAPQEAMNCDVQQRPYNPYAQYGDTARRPDKPNKVPKKKKKTGLVIAIISAAVLLLAGLGVGGYFWINKITKDLHKEKYMLTFESSQGGKVLTESKEYPEGASVELVAEPDSGYVFSRWVRSDSEDIEGANNSTVTMIMPSRDVVVSAVFITDFQSATTEADIYAYKVFNSLTLKFTDGDYADSVTKNIELCKECSEDKMTAVITWDSSDASVIDDDGMVVRPDDNDVAVKLTARISVGDVELVKEFEVKVISYSDFDYDEAPNYSILDIEELNGEDTPAEITYTDNMEYVESISGRFSEVCVNSEEAALQALCNVKGLLGIQNPLDSLRWKATNYDNENLIYSFAQYRDNNRVYGFSVTVSADRNSGETLYLKSSLVPDIVLDKTNTSTDYPVDKFREAYPDISFDSVETVVYAMGDYANSPILAYYGVSAEENVMVSAVDGTELLRYSNVCTWGDYSTTGTGKDEQGNTQTFPVQFHQWDWWFYYLEDIERGIYIKGDKAGVFAHECNTNWEDPTAISAYVNMIEVYDWYKLHLKRNSIDNNGMNIYVNVHSFGNKDNACWNGNTHQMYFYDNKNVNDGKIPTTAAGLDILAHETTHGMLQYILSGNGVSDFPYKDFTGAINEGYADVFGWLVDHDDNTLGEDWLTLRSLSNPSDYDAPVKYSDYREYYTDDGKYNQSKMVHTNSSLVYHAAYLMEKYGIKGTNLEQLWYKSLLLGYDASSTFFSVRKNMIQAGKNLGFNDEKMCAIRRAFDDEEIYGEKGNLTIFFKDSSGNPIEVDELSGLSISVRGMKKCYPDNTYTTYQSSDNECLFRDTYKGIYAVNISADGYSNFSGEIEVEECKTAVLQVVLVRDGEVKPVTGYITGATTGVGVEGVNIVVLAGWNKKGGIALANTTTDSNGMYSLDLTNGYYTLVLTKDNYTRGYLNVIASPDYNDIYQNGSISPIIENVSNYRIVLSWGMYPSDLDAHLSGKDNNGSSFHVYYSNKSGYYNGELSAELDVDDRSSYGPETITFAVNTELEYQYYIDWYTGSGTWASCDGKVEVYSGSTLLYVFHAPDQPDSMGDWLVFTIKNGIFKAEDTIIQR